MTPEPLTPPDCDLTDFKFMPLEVARLRKSREWREGRKNPEIAFCSINLWCASWHEVPAASLEDDDETLAEFAMCDLKRWKKIKTLVLRKWVKCSDGRLYHPIVAEKANESWDAKTSQRNRTAAARAAKERNKLQPNSSTTTTAATALSQTTVTDDVTGSKGREGKGREVEGKGQTLPQSDKALQEAEAARAYESIEKLLNLAVPIPFAPIRGWLDAGFDLDRDIVPAITEVVSRQRSKVPAWKPGSLRYFDQAVRTAHADRIGSGRSNGTVTGPKPADTPEGERKLLEVKAKILNAGTRYEDTTQTEVDAMIAAKLTTPEKARAMGFRA